MLQINLRVWSVAASPRQSSVAKLRRNDISTVGLAEVKDVTNSSGRLKIQDYFQTSFPEVGTVSWTFLFP